MRAQSPPAAFNYLRRRRVPCRSPMQVSTGRHRSISIAFWDDVECALAELHRVLKPGGRMVHVMMPQWLKGDEAAIDRLAVAISAAVERAGFHDVRRDSRATWPVRSVAVIATR